MACQGQSFVDRDMPESLTATVAQPEAGAVQALLDQVEVMDVAGTWSATERVPDVVDPPVKPGDRAAPAARGRDGEGVDLPRCRECVREQLFDVRIAADDPVEDDPVVFLEREPRGVADRQICPLGES